MSLKLLWLTKSRGLTIYFQPHSPNNFLGKLVKHSCLVNFCHSLGIFACMSTRERHRTCNSCVQYLSASSVADGTHLWNNYSLHAYYRYNMFLSVPAYLWNYHTIKLIQQAKLKWSPLSNTSCL